MGIASVGFDSDANRIANEAPSWLGNLVYVYGALRALVAWRRRDSRSSSTRRASAAASRPTRSAPANSQTYGGGMRAAPDALLDDGLLEVVVLENVSKLAFLTRILPKVFSGSTCTSPA